MLFKRIKYEDFLEIKGKSLLEFKDGNSILCIAPDMGGRVFAFMEGLSLHRIDLENIQSPNRPFNNFGGGNLWPAPEGGKFGFNYRGNEWYVQECINSQPYNILLYNKNSAVIEKEIILVNRSNTIFNVIMKRKISICDIPPFFKGWNISNSITYLSEDSFEVLNDVRIENGLIAAWTLEQFDANENTISFCLVNSPENAINFDFYEPPIEKIVYYKKGFTYQTDGMKKGQIGIRRKSNPKAIGFIDFERKIVCIRQNLTSTKNGLYFNIADNEQPGGAFSAEDTYSIFNSSEDMRFFELETISCSDINCGKVIGSTLVSLTSFAFFENIEELKTWKFLDDVI